MTLHTVLSRPTLGQGAALARLCRGADAVTVFTPTARTLAVTAGLAGADRMFVVPHGAPTVLREDWDRPHTFGARPRRPGLRAEGLRPAVADVLAENPEARIVSTFGLVSPGKGLEVAIEAVAALVGDHPDLMYVIAGATHPECGGAGLTVEPGDSAAFAVALGTLMAVPDRLNAARAAADRVGSTLRWPAVAGRFATVVRHVAAKRPPISVGEQVRRGFPGVVTTRSVPLGATVPAL